MYCKNCGAEIDDNAYVCIKCGVKTNTETNNKVVANDDAPNAGFAILCFLIPILGLILWLVWKDNYPLKAKSCGKGALISVIVSVSFYVLVFILAFIGACSSAMYY